MPRLPPGCEAFLTWSKECGGRYYEFHRVYDRRQRIDRGRSFWITVPPEFEGPESVRSLSFDDLRRTLGRRAPDFAAFSSEMAPPRLLEDWFRVAGASILPHAEPPSPMALPWQYEGVHWDGADWTRCSGFVPNDGQDEPALARDAAEALGADRVILRDGAGRLRAIRDADGALVDSPADSAAGGSVISRKYQYD